MSQLALNDVERYAFPGHLHCMGVAQLVWSESSPRAEEAARAAGGVLTGEQVANGN